MQGIHAKSLALKWLTDIEFDTQSYCFHGASNVEGILAVVTDV